MDLMMSIILAAVFPRIKRFQFVKFFRHTQSVFLSVCDAKTFYREEF